MLVLPLAFSSYPYVGRDALFSETSGILTEGAIHSEYIRACDNPKTIPLMDDLTNDSTDEIVVICDNTLTIFNFSPKGLMPTML